MPFASEAASWACRRDAHIWGYELHLLTLWLVDSISPSKRLSKQQFPVWADWFLAKLCCSKWNTTGEWQIEPQATNFIETSLNTKTGTAVVKTGNRGRHILLILRLWMMRCLSFETSTSVTILFHLGLTQLLVSVKLGQSWSKGATHFRFQSKCSLPLRSCSTFLVFIVSKVRCTYKTPVIYTKSRFCRLTQFELRNS